MKCCHLGFTACGGPVRRYKVTGPHSGERERRYCSEHALEVSTTTLGTKAEPYQLLVVEIPAGAPPSKAKAARA